ncbi:MAG: polyprenyl synthetase family protein [Marinovum sp.]|jgi:farnesyl diphosphate synthase|nr:polyprenyl synthetase family protein [Marinovum sp.]MBT4871571.1 polyprenyl synthetase family protein [Marinovum sp.]
MFRERLAQHAAIIQTHLDQTITPMGDAPVVQGMRYALRGGKRLRAFLVMQSAAIYDLPHSQSIWPAAAIEAIHAYSLVHDDLPCMDDDDLRRGQPTVHKKWDQATAVLVGDALQSLGFELVLNPHCSPIADLRADLALRLARAAGGAGMVLGQAQDIAAETAPTPLDLAQITELQQGKTGALISWSAQAGAILAQEDPAPLAQYSAALGLGFQITDDILDVEGDPEKIGKRLNKDAKAGKATFVSLLGLDGAKKRAKELISEACDAVTPLGKNAQPLQHCAKFIISRES